LSSREFDEMVDSAFASAHSPAAGPSDIPKLKIMYQIDKTTNSITPLSAKGFGALGFNERAHLQEWIAKCPECLGEELLIIAKEFDGFDETKERLDLLALDKQGSLVVIENNLDDSGRDVVWQALKYASYCSSLSKSQIVAIFQSHLSKNGGGDARVSSDN
jgi:hypothetical protein